ncbi:MAG: ABC transporter permease [Planctomycetota bacterium]|nr:ABC transporter permease [Planctomycetota bacterium]
MTEAQAAPAAPAPAPAKPSAMAHFMSILADRYLSLTLADTGATLILLLQAPIIGGVISVAWKNGVQDQRILNFILSLVAVWFGCVNASREVVKERPIFLREKRLGVPVSSYLLSKFMVLALIAFIQCLVLTLLVYSNVPGYKLSRITLMVYLYLGSLAGTSLGLLVSCCVKSQNTAVGIIPILLIPQVIFSEVVLGTKENRTEQFEIPMPVSWTYEALSSVWDSGWKVSDVLPTLFALPALCLCFLALAAFVLSFARED